MLHSNQNFTVDECRKIFAYFLNAKEIKQNFRRESYGYRTYNNSWKIFVNQRIIVRHLLIFIGFLKYLKKNFLILLKYYHLVLLHKN